MQNRLMNEIRKRKEEIYQFYYRGIGVSIKKRRLELKMTQETLAKGICSNTYISKLENNAIVVNKENLNLIMEKMDLPQDRIGFPEDMVAMLEKTFDYFIRKDKEEYRRIYERISGYQVGILVVLVRFGYLVLTENQKEAKPLYLELFQYLNSLEEYGLTVFAIYASFYNIMICNFEQAGVIIESADRISYLNRDISSMMAFVRYVVYGHLYMFSQARDCHEIAMGYFVKTNNLPRIAEMMIYHNVFLIYDKAPEKVKFSSQDLDFLSGRQKNFYFCVLAYADNCPERYLVYVDKDARFYDMFLFTLSLSYQQRQMDDEYQKTRNAIAMIEARKREVLDLVRFLELRMEKDSTAYKDFLINFAMPYFMSIQNIWMLDIVTEEIIGLLRSRKRYKDALGYREKYRKFVRKLQGKKNN